MSKNIVITIGRQFGSGGRELGERLAKELNIPFYDKELVELAAEKSEMNHDVLKDIDERATNSFLYSLVTGSNSMRGMATPLYYEMPINDKLFILQSDIIKNLALKGSCVIVGRCADYVLESVDVNCANIFVYSSMKNKIERISKLYDLSPEKAKDRIVKTEKKRRTYYNYYSNQEWGKMESHDLCINSGVISMEDAVNLAKEFALMKQRAGKTQIE